MRLARFLAPLLLIAPLASFSSAATAEGEARAASLRDVSVRDLAATRDLAAARDPVPERDELPPELKAVGVDEHLKGQLPLDARFVDDHGKSVTLGDLYGARPTVLVFAYFRCPVVCSMIQNAAASALKQIEWTAGKEYDVVVVSIDPTDTPGDAAKKKADLVATYGRGEPRGWHYLTGTKPEIDRVAKAAGFSYFYDERQNQYGHPSLIMMTTPEGKMARYLYGIDYEPKDVKLALLEASEGRAISTVEKLILFCYHYDPVTRGYSLFATRLMRVGGALTVLLLGGFLGMMWRRERRKSLEGSRSGPKTGPQDNHGGGPPPSAPSSDAAPPLARLSQGGV